MSCDNNRLPDFRVASPARMYDYLLGGKNHFPADREAADRVIAAYPQTRILARRNRRFLTRAVWYLAEHGIRQYVDLGSGLPTSPNVHEVARQVIPDARVVYVDNDPVALGHVRAICGGDDGVGVVEGDLRAPLEILDDKRLSNMIDLTMPVAFLCVAVLQFVTNEHRPEEITTALRNRMAHGSYLVITHPVTDGMDPEVVAEAAEAYDKAAASVTPRTSDDVRSFFAGLDLIEPGLVDVSQWRPDIREKETKLRFIAGVGRKSCALSELLKYGWIRAVRHSRCIYCLETGLEGQCSSECHPNRACQTFTHLIIYSFVRDLQEIQLDDDSDPEEESLSLWQTGPTTAQLLTQGSRKDEWQGAVTRRAGTLTVTARRPISAKGMRLPARSVRPRRRQMFRLWAVAITA